MDPEHLEKFVVLYLKSHNLKYKIKNRIYTISLDKAHERWFGSKELTCTFDQSLARTKKIILLGAGNSIVQTMLAAYTDKVVFTSLTLPKDKQFLLDVNDKLSEHPKKGIKYMITEEFGTMEYVLFEVAISTAHEKNTSLNPLLLFQDHVLSAPGVEKTSLLDEPRDINYHEQLQKMVAELPMIMQESLAHAEQKHEQDMKELMRILTEHSENQYRELQKKEDEILNKIEELKEKSVKAASFDTRHDLDLKVKELRKKHSKQIENNQEARTQIKQDFDKEISSLKKRELNTTTRVVAYATIKAPYFKVQWSDKEADYYLPLLGHFVKS